MRGLMAALAACGRHVPPVRHISASSMLSTGSCGGCRCP